MKFFLKNNKKNLITRGEVLSDGSAQISPGFYFNYKTILSTTKNQDMLNHVAWTGRRFEEQDEVASFITKWKNF